MGASASHEEDQPRIIQSGELTPKNIAVNQITKELEKLEKLVPTAALRTDVAWHDLLFLAQIGDDPDRDVARKGLEDLWRVLKEWSEANGTKVTSGQEGIWALFSEVLDLGSKLEDSSRGLARTCRGTSEGLRSASPLKQLALDVLKEVNDVSNRVEKLHRASQPPNQPGS
ncbi:hypothetical protein BSKO_12090 [Bryopsis sp. KO-2023]|nr:hypothetical protein BSKO_12090 [Bryopsis sp. KO-2023]